MENNNKPLYKVLNEQRTQGDWKPSSDGVDMIAGGIPATDKRILFARTTNTKINAVANIAYTALAVNNLHHLAEALTELNEAINGDIFNDDDKTQRLMAARIGLFQVITIF